MSEQYDFFDIGQRKAQESIEELKSYAENIGKAYGDNAKLEFEAGVAAAEPVYSQVFGDDKNKPQDKINANDKIHGTHSYGVPGKRNNSYFGTTGTGNQTKADGSYNEPPKFGK